MGIVIRYSNNKKHGFIDVCSVIYQLFWECHGAIRSQTYYRSKNSCYGERCMNIIDWKIYKCVRRPLKNNLVHWFNCNGQRLCLCIDRSLLCAAGGTKNKHKSSGSIAYNFPNKLLSKIISNNNNNPTSTKLNERRQHKGMIWWNHGFKKYRHCGSDDVMQCENLKIVGAATTSGVVCWKGTKEPPVGCHVSW